MKKFDFGGRKLKVNLRSDADQSVFEEIFKDCDYRILDEVIKNASDAIIDVGAHIGLFSLYASVLNPDVPIFAFEPDIDNFLLLKENLKLNNVKNVKAKNLAVSASGGESGFQRCACYLRYLGESAFKWRPAFSSNIFVECIAHAFSRARGRSFAALDGLSCGWTAS